MATAADSVPKSGWLKEVTRQTGFWLIAAAMTTITLFHYRESLQHPAFVNYLAANLNLSRHVFERILYLLPMVYAGVFFRAKGWVIVSALALGAMIPRAVFITQTPRDAIFEVVAVMIVNGVLFLLLESLRKEKQHLHQIEAAHQQLKASEERYRGLFENAIDAIFIQDLEGNIVEANEACGNVLSRGRQVLVGANVRSLLAEEGFASAREIKAKLLTGETIPQPYEQQIIRKDGSKGVVKLATSVIVEAGKPVGFQHIARDVTEEKRMQENLRYYVQQVTIAQEEERKRIARELHDDTAQALIALSRQLDSFGYKEGTLSPEVVGLLDSLRAKVDTLLHGVRRFSRDLRPSVLDDLGLLPALEWLATDLNHNFNVAAEVRVHGEPMRLPPEAEVVLFRIAQEAMRNVWKHAEASHAEVDLDFGSDAIRLSIRDDGKGFKQPRVISDLVSSGKLGLAGMQERISLLGGTLRISSAPGNGTTVLVQIPNPKS